MRNREFARLLNQMADILELKEVQWKPQAYRRAARSIESLEKDIADIYREDGRKGLDAIPGVGEAIASHIEEFLKTGHVEKFDKLMKEFPRGTSELLELQGLGPKKVKRLSDIGVKTIAELRKAVSAHKIRDIEGFGEKTEEELAKSMEMSKGRKERMLLGTALPVAEEIINYLKGKAPVRRIAYAGSLRRMAETIGDVDILVTSSNPGKVMDALASMEQVSRVLSKGRTKSSVITGDGVQVDVRIVPEASFGAALQYFTGNKDHNVELRKIAIRKGYKLSEYGLQSRKTGRNAASSEKDIYRKLGFDYIPPELREQRGELDAARNGKLPHLIEIGDMAGDLQMHTRASDGENTIQEMMSGAEKLGYEYVAITDHSESTRIGNGLDEKRLGKHLAEIEKASSGSGIAVLKGSEVDIRSDGRLDYGSGVLDRLDIVIASIHSGFKMPRDRMTSRIVKAFETGRVNLFAHPTGRLIGRREPYDFDADRVFQAAKDNGVAVEINSDPERLDLNDAGILRAREFGVRFAINTDAHSVNGLDNMKYGVAQARRGWLEKKDVINTFPLRKMLKLLGK